MANNRLYIVDMDTGDKFMLAKSMGDGWYIRSDNPDGPNFAERFEAWADKRDPCSYGNVRQCSTRFRLICENDPAWEAECTSASS